MKPTQTKPDYGMDAPAIAHVVVPFVLLGAIAAFFLHRAPNEGARTLASVIFPFVQTGLCAIILSLIYVKWEKFRHRDRMLNMLSWTGREQVLDIGTGRGLLLVGAAKRLTSGRSVGIDVWNQSDMRDTSEEAVRRNAELEGVGEKVEVQSADARHLPFADASFDYVLSNLCLHNIPGKEGRAEACREIVRVLKPGGTALISDFIHTREYAAAFRKQGLESTRSISVLIAPFLLKIVSVKKNDK